MGGLGGAAAGFCPQHSLVSPLSVNVSSTPDICGLSPNE